MGSVIGYQEAHGPVATFETDVAGKIRSLVADIEPVQDLHGYGHPWPAGGGKNLLPNNAVTETTNDITFTVNNDGTVRVNGTASDETNLFIYSQLILQSGNYILNGCPTGGSTSTYRIFATNIGSDVGNGISFTTDGSMSTTIRINIKSGIAIDNLVFKPMIRLATESDATFTPYSNICPITGWTGANITVNSNVITITFPSEVGTVYGGALRLVKGELVVDRAQIASYNGETLPGEWISDRDVYAAGASPTTGAQVVYDLATPITYQLTPQEINTIIGTNTIYADTGDTSVIYPKTITPIETVSNVNLMELRRNIITAMQHNYIPDITTYGVEWNYSNPSTVLTRTGNAANLSNPIPATSNSNTGSSPFDNIYPWSEMKRYNIINGEVAYSEDDAGYSETDYDTVVYIPEFYYKAEKDTINEKWNWNISGRPIEGYEKHPGSGRYVGRFHTSGSSSGVFSKGGVTPLASTTRADFRTYSHNKGSNWWQIDIKTWSAIQLLYLIEFANWNSKDRLNRGQNTGAVVNTGATTNAAYHTLKRTGASGNMYRWIENPYSNLWIWLDGYIASNRVSYIFLTNPANYSDDTGDAETVGINIPSTNFITDFGYSNKCAWAFIPNAGLSSAAYTTYVTDKCYSTTGDNNLIAGGYYMNYNDYGFFYFNATYPKSNANAKIGSRLIYIPTT